MLFIDSKYYFATCIVACLVFYLNYRQQYRGVPLSVLSTFFMLDLNRLHNILLKFSRTRFCSFFFQGLVSARGNLKFVFYFLTFIAIILVQLRDDEEKNNSETNVVRCLCSG